MDAREYLEQVGVLNRAANIRLKQVQSLRDSLSISSAPTDTERVSHSRNTDAMCAKIAAIVDGEHEVDALVDQLVSLKAEICRKLDLLENDQEELFLIEHFLNLKKQTAIAEEQMLSARWVRRVIKNGLEHLQIILDAENEKLFCG